MAKKTDNSNLPAKLELRRHFLRKYHADQSPDVLDCCQGSGTIWNHLRQEFEIRSYWGLDEKPKKGRLKIDSARVLAQPGWNQNVVDIDTYGLPWKHWLAMLPNVRQATTAFLTLGSVASGQGSTASKAELEALGMRFSRRLPARFTISMIRQQAVPFLLHAKKDSVIITEAVEIVSHGNARYIGVRLEPANKSGGQVESAPARQHRRTKKESSHA